MCAGEGSGACIIDGSPFVSCWQEGRRFSEDRTGELVWKVAIDAPSCAVPAMMSVADADEVDSAGPTGTGSPSSPATD